MSSTLPSRLVSPRARANTPSRVSIKISTRIKGAAINCAVAEAPYSNAMTIPSKGMRERVIQFANMFCSSENRDQ